jgi:2,3-dihydroxyphenylpropionate 1,2-dioxygenase
MADIVLGVGASHTTLMNTQWQRVDHLPRAHHYRDALRDAAGALLQSKPDVIVIVGSNHFRGFWLDLMPAFTIGVGEVLSSGEHGTPAGAMAAHAALGREVCASLMRQNFDIAFSSRLTVDHGVSHAIQWIVGESALPIVPIVVNCFAPPLPSLKRCQAFGMALERALCESVSCQRVAIIGTGGLSHTLPFPDWRAPASDDDQFLVDSWTVGRGRWQEFEARRRSIVVNAPPRLNERFDTEYLERLTHGRLDTFPNSFSDEELVKLAGNGAAELRAWQIMAAVLGHRPGRVLAYSPMPEWLTGMAVAIINGSDQTSGDKS